MKIYFLSSRPCALFFNDVYFGVTDLFERFAEIDLRDKLFIRFVPQNAQPLSFFLTEEIRFTPPEGCEVYLLKDGLAVYAKDFAPQHTALRVIAQARFGDNLATVYEQGAIQLALETARGSFLCTLPHAFTQCEIEQHGELFFLRAPDTLCIYTQAGECVFCEKVRTFSVEGNTLRAVIPLCDSLGRVAECSYTLHGEGCERIQYTLKQARTQSGEADENKIRDELIAYAFFESVFIGAEYEEMLADGLKPSASKIKAYLGDFTAVLVTDKAHTCGLVKEKAPRLFEVVYYTVTVENGKITDIQGCSHA